ncbi:MAG: hypothetical protein HC803_11370 [Saprospiraceae bacterium]|nr:hypothetical protein [Saprospiraceae bacterium]
MFGNQRTERIGQRKYTINASLQIMVAQNYIYLVGGYTMRTDLEGRYGIK